MIFWPVATVKMCCFLLHKMLMDWSHVDYFWIMFYYCFYQLFGLSFWWHPLTAEDLLVSIWYNVKFSKYVLMRKQFISILHGLRLSTYLVLYACFWTLERQWCLVCPSSVASYLALVYIRVHLSSQKTSLLCGIQTIIPSRHWPKKLPCVK